MYFRIYFIVQLGQVVPGSESQVTGVTVVEMGQGAGFNPGAIRFFWHMQWSLPVAVSVDLTV